MRKSNHIKYMTFKRRLSIYLYWFLGGFWLAILIGINFIWAPHAKAQLIDPSSATTSTLSVKPATGQDAEVAGVTYSQFKDYVRQIFGNKANIALAVSACECSTKRKEWPNCLNSWGEKDKGEHSVGAFQINLASGSGSGPWVQAGKIPSDTIGKKELWLMDYRQNTMAAFVISKGGTDFSPWTGYSSGCYLTKLNGI